MPWNRVAAGARSVSGNLPRPLVVLQAELLATEQRHPPGCRVRLDIRLIHSVATHAKRVWRGAQQAREIAGVRVMAEQTLASFVRAMEHRVLPRLMAQGAEFAARRDKRDRCLGVFGDRLMAGFATHADRSVDELPFLRSRVTDDASLRLYVSLCDERVVDLFLCGSLINVQGRGCR